MNEQEKMQEALATKGQEKIMQILTELKAAHSSAISALNHINDLTCLCYQRKKELEKCQR